MLLWRATVPPACSPLGGILLRVWHQRIAPNGQRELSELDEASPIAMRTQSRWGTQGVPQRGRGRPRGPAPTDSLWFGSERYSQKCGLLT
jgi:hypothetical protein